MNISIHPPRAGRDPVGFLRKSDISDFNPPAPCGAGPFKTEFQRQSVTISIHPPRAGRDMAIGILVIQTPISIHPPRAGRDVSTI